MEMKVTLGNLIFTIFIWALFLAFMILASVNFHETHNALANFPTIPGFPPPSPLRPSARAIAEFVLQIFFYFAVAIGITVAINQKKELNPLTKIEVRRSIFLLIMIIGIFISLAGFCMFLIARFSNPSNATLTVVGVVFMIIGAVCGYFGAFQYAD